MRIVQIIAKSQDELGVPPKLHPTIDTFLDIGESAQIAMPVEPLKVKEKF